MTALASIRSALVSAIAAQVPTVQVLGIPPGEAAALREGIWVESASCEFEWRSLGRGSVMSPKNRVESATIELRIHVYREAADATDAADDALDRAEALLAEVEDALEADESLGGACSFALVERWAVTPVAREAGWQIDGRATVLATNHP